MIVTAQQGEGDRNGEAIIDQQQWAKEHQEGLRNAGEAVKMMLLSTSAPGTSIAAVVDVVKNDPSLHRQKELLEPLEVRAAFFRDYEPNGDQEQQQDVGRVLSDDELTPEARARRNKELMMNVHRQRLEKFAAGEFAQEA